MLEKYLPDLVRPAGLYELKTATYFFISAWLSPRPAAEGLYRRRDPSYPPSSTRVIVARYGAVGSKPGERARRRTEGMERRNVHSERARRRTEGAEAP